MRGWNGLFRDPDFCECRLVCPDSCLTAREVWSLLDVAA